MRPSRRRVTAVALLVFGLALAPLSARPVHGPRHVSTAASPMASTVSQLAAAWHQLLSLVGLRARDESGTGGDPQGSVAQPIPPPVAGDIRAGLDPNG